jgi:hypothetical protein
LNALEVLKMVEAFANTKNIRCKIQRRSVKLMPADLQGVSVDVVPAFRCSNDPDYYWIPTIDRNSTHAPAWVLTSPAAAQDACTSANKVRNWTT